MYKCEQCHKSFAGRPNLTQHYLSHVTEKPFLCDFCPKRFNRRPDLLRHLRRHTGEKPFVCDLCQKGYAERAALIKHAKLHEEGYPCDRCGEKFLSKGELNKHILVQHERTHWCGTCERRFASQSLLEKHMLTHSSAGKAFRCDGCGKGYSHKVSLKRHRLSQGNCKKSTCRKSLRETHSGCDDNSSSSLADGTRQSDDPPTGEAKPFECQICHRGYLREIDLNRHLRTHVSEEFRSLGCEWCGKGVGSQRHICKQYLRSLAEGKKLEAEDETCVLYKSVKNYGNRIRLPSEELIKIEDS